MNTRVRIIVTILFLTCFAMGAPFAMGASAAPIPQGGDGGKPSVLDITSAEQYVKQFEFEADCAEGKPFNADRAGGEAMRRVRDLMKRFPDDPDVQALFDRVRVCVKMSRGDYFEITPEMLAYRELERIVHEKIGDLAVAKWEETREELRASERFFPTPFPAPDPGLGNNDLDMFYRQVVLEGFEFPANEFTNTGRQFVYVGGPNQGYYFVELSNRRWLGAYEAVRRYQREVTGGLPSKWYIAGTIIGSDMMVPRSGEQSTGEISRFGWLVRLDAIYVPGHTFAYPDASHPSSGRYVGEETLAEIKAPFLTHTEVPDGVEPTALVRIMCAAAKEKNYKLFQDCIDPEVQATPLARERLRNLWDHSQVGFATDYVHVEPLSEGKPIVIQGERFDDEDLDSFFLDEEDKDEILDRADDLVEEVHVTVRRFDEKGKQVGTPRDVILRRREGGRWYIRKGIVL